MPTIGRAMFLSFKPHSQDSERLPRRREACAQKAHCSGELYRPCKVLPKICPAARRFGDGSAGAGPFDPAQEVGKRPPALGAKSLARFQGTDPVDAEHADIVPQLAPRHQRPDLAPEPQPERAERPAAFGAVPVSVWPISGRGPAPESSRGRRTRVFWGRRNGSAGCGPVPRRLPSPRPQRGAAPCATPHP